jgi:HK97 gp10 family phage protein
VASELFGVAELTKQLAELADPKKQAAALRESVRKPMLDVKKVAEALIQSTGVSPGKAESHRSYKGDIITRGYASRNFRVITKMSRDKQSATAILGLRAKAFYASQFHELGTSTLPKRPFLVPAFEQSKDAALRKIGATMRARIERIAKQRAAGVSRGGSQPMAPGRVI